MCKAIENAIGTNAALPEQSRQNLSIQEQILRASNSTIAIHVVEVFWRRYIKLVQLRISAVQVRVRCLSCS